MQVFKVSASSNNQRVDSFVANNVKELSRSFINQLSADGKVLVNSKSVKPSYRVKAGDTVSLRFDIESLKNPPKVKIPIIYEDKDVVVLDKPAGILTHSKGAYNPEGTVATFIADKIKQMSGNRAGIVHRLDRRTSGIIITAKNPEALKWLQRQFSSRKARKVYIAVVEGGLEPAAAVIDMPIGRNPDKPQKFRVSSNGKPAATEYKTLKKLDRYSLVELRPKTGRTHQLRVHMSKQGHPIAGDDLYGAKPADRLYLHAKELEITLPSKKRKIFISKVPKRFQDILE